MKVLQELKEPNNLLKVFRKKVIFFNSLLNVFKLYTLILSKSSEHGSYSWKKWFLADNDWLKKHINELNVVHDIQQRHTQMQISMGRNI